MTRHVILTVHLGITALAAAHVRADRDGPSTPTTVPDIFSALKRDAY